MTITVSQHTPGQIRQTIQISSHQLNADASEAAGGSATGPDPHDLFDAALATCKAMTLQLYAKRKNIPLQEVKVEISRDDSDEAKGLYQLHVRLELIGELTTEQRGQLLAIADKCPIHKLMTQTEVQVHTSLKAEPAPTGLAEPLIIQPQERDIGFIIKRLLPAKAQRRVGPFIFVDHMGPATFTPDSTEGDVRQHPHIGLATVTYLFSGAMQHRDTLGNNQRIEPGAVNLMRAGRGIAHSERIPADIRTEQVKVEGMQIWLILPEDEAGSEPAFQHYPAALFPAIQVPGSEIRVLLGEYFSQTSVVSFPARCCYAELKLTPCSSLNLPKSEQQLAIYLAAGSLKEPVLSAGQMLVMTEDLTVVAGDDGAHFMVLGGDEVEDPVLLNWNFVARSPEPLAQAKEDWNSGVFPRLADDPEWIPAP
jgi:redox-sensitive bicupin YhaK (pirin superfamily)/uncharacterized OsmC-like protein